jgi:hypothetical protein
VPLSALSSVVAVELLNILCIFFAPQGRAEGVGRTGPVGTQHLQTIL